MGESVGGSMGESVGESLGESMGESVGESQSINHIYRRKLKITENFTLPQGSDIVYVVCFSHICGRFGYNPLLQFFLLFFFLRSRDSW